MRKTVCGMVLAAMAACGDDGRPDSGGASVAATMTATGSTGTATGTATEASSGTTGGEPTSSSSPVTAGTTGVKLDVGPELTTGVGTGSTGEPVDMCKVQDDMNAIGDCSQVAPPDSFEPEIQWSWTGPDGDVMSIITPLVANLTDDNGDGEIDLCDVPDIVILASQNIGGDGHLYVLDGATGALHFRIEQVVSATITPAIGDLDGDGLPEIVAGLSGNALIAFEHDGTFKWQSQHLWLSAFLSAIALADVDNDGSAEIVVVSNMFAGEMSPTVQVIRDKEDRWIQARRIWNQHTYHVTNVREDGTIPQFEKPHWQLLNTFRTNAQIEGGGLCEPPIPG